MSYVPYDWQNVTRSSKNNRKDNKLVYNFSQFVDIWIL